MEDAYSYYVFVVGISEDLFWNAEASELMTIVENKRAYENWLSYARQKLSERS
ncbi:MAG: hypothetical protein LUD72_04610 [Bacteroidales bacterium]|nr:hypothetical protein [Bacteroidales bacterium]